MNNNTFDQETFAHLIPDYIQRLQPYVAGKPIWEVQAEYGIERVDKLASNENSLGPSHKALEAIRQRLSETYRYPDTAGLKLRGALAERFGVKVGNIVLGNGSEGIMSYIMRTFLQQDDQVISVDATFVGFKVMAQARAEAPIIVPLNDYRFDLQAIADHVTERTKIIYLCNPNNPTGTYFTDKELDAFLERLPKRVLVILDEAYFEFAKEFPDYPDSMHYRHDQVITLRTFSKAYGLAGVRIGYGIAHEYLIGNLMKIKLPFEPSDLAQAAGLGALEDEEFLEQTLTMNREGREYFYREFGRLDLRYYPTASNFILLVFKDEEEVMRLHDFLLRRGVIIRPLKGFGLPHCMRVTIGTMAENRRCILALREWCGRG